MALDVVYLGKMSKVCAHQTLTNMHTHTHGESEKGACAHVPPPDIHLVFPA